MKKARKVFYAIIITVFILPLSCQKQDNQPFHEVVQYYLTPSEKLYLNNSDFKDSILFFDTISNEFVQFITKQKYDVTYNDDSKNDIGPGEILSIKSYSDSTTGYLGGSMIYSLFASSNTDCFLEVNVDGTEFAFDPNDNNKIDTSFTIPNAFRYSYFDLGFAGHYRRQLLDSITLVSQTFYNVYCLKTDPTINDTLILIDYCYYTRNKGIIAIHEKNNAFLVRVN